MRSYEGTSIAVDHPLVDAVVLAGRWTARDLSGLEKTLDHLHSLGKAVILVGPAIQYDSPLPRLIAAQLKRGDATFVASHRLLDVFKTDTKLKLLAARKAVEYISLVDHMCDRRRQGCIERTPSGDPIQFDYGHFTSDGSVLVALRAFKQL